MLKLEGEDDHSAGITGCFQLYVHVDSFYCCAGFLMLTFIQWTGLTLGRHSSDWFYGYQLG